MTDDELDKLAREIVTRHLEYVDGLERGQAMMKTSNAIKAVKEALQINAVTIRRVKLHRWTEQELATFDRMLRELDERDELSSITILPFVPERGK